GPPGHVARGARHEEVEVFHAGPAGPGQGPAQAALGAVLDQDPSPPARAEGRTPGEGAAAGAFARVFTPGLAHQGPQLGVEESLAAGAVAGLDRAHGRSGARRPGYLALRLAPRAP